MTIRVVCLNRGSNKAWEQAADEYAKRLERYCKVWREPAKRNTKERAKNTGMKSGYLVRVKPEGAVLSSEELAKWLQDLMNSGISDVAFLINRGADEKNDPFLSEINQELSLSGLDLPDDAACALLLEQIYRGFKIMRGESYHK